MLKNLFQYEYYDNDHFLFNKFDQLFSTLVHYRTINSNL